MVTYKVKNKTDEYIDYYYYVEGHEDDRGVLRYYLDKVWWEPIVEAPGDFGRIYCNHVGNKLHDDGVRDSGMVAWY